MRSLDADQWATPSRCAGWSVGDVAGHVIGSPADVVNARLEGLGTAAFGLDDSVNLYADRR